MSIRKAKLKTHTMKCNSLLPAKVACGADLKQSWNDMKLHEMTWNDISNSQATHIKQSKIVKTSQARTCSPNKNPWSNPNVSRLGKPSLE